jgi:hypothetical protein
MYFFPANEERNPSREQIIFCEPRLFCEPDVEREYVHFNTESNLLFLNRQYGSTSCEENTKRCSSDYNY